MPNQHVQPSSEYNQLIVETEFEFFLKATRSFQLSTKHFFVPSLTNCLHNFVNFPISLKSSLVYYTPHQKPLSSKPAISEKTSTTQTTARKH